MTLDNLAGKYGLAGEERQIFDEYTTNRFAGAQEIGEPDTSFLGFWERTIEYARLFGRDADALLRDPYTVVTPGSSNPYQQMYVAN